MNETVISGDGEAVNTNSSPKTSYKDYLPLWEFLLERGKFKVYLLIMKIVLDLNYYVIALCTLNQY